MQPMEKSRRAHLDSRKALRHAGARKNDQMAQEQKHEQEFRLSDLEAWILETVDNIGWYSYLWFPIVYREVMNFGDDSSDEEVFSAFSGLVRKGR